MIRQKKTLDQRLFYTSRYLSNFTLHSELEKQHLFCLQEHFSIFIVH